MNKIKAKVHKYHRELGIIFSLPLALCAITAMGMTIARLFHNMKLAKLLLQIHTMEILPIHGIEEIYAVLVGLSLLGLIITGFIMMMPNKKRQ